MENDDPMETEDSLTNKPDTPSTEHQNKQVEDPFQFLQFPQPSPKKIAQNPKQSPNINQIPNSEIPIKERLIYEQKFNQIENEMIKTRTELKIQQENHQKSLLKLQEKEKEILDLKSQLGQRAVSPVREDSVKYTILLQKKQEEIVKLSSENADLVQREKETRTILAQVRQQNNDLQQVDLQQKQKIVNLTHENDRFIKQNEWFQSELNQKSLEFDTYRKEKHVQISKLQNDLENEAQENNSLTTRNDLLQKRLNELEEKYSEKIEKIRKTENDKIMTEQQFKNEMISQKKLADLYFQKQKETSNKNQELEDLIRELEIKLMDLDSAKEHEKVEYESEVQSLKDQLSQQGLEIEKLSSELEIINNELNKQNTYSQVFEI
jgi:nucleoprotein TPR